MLGLWDEKTEFVKNHGGAAVLAPHPEPHFFGNADGINTYARFLKDVAMKKKPWFVTIGQLVNHVRGTAGAAR